MSSGGTETQGRLWASSGQGTLEYALVLFAFLAVVGALAAMWHVGRDGRLLQLAKKAASHLLGAGNAIGSARDVLLF